MNLQELSIDGNERIYLDVVEIPNVKEYILKGSAEKETEMTLTIDVITNKIHSRKNEESSMTKLKTWALIGTLAVKESTLIEQIMREQLGLLHERSKEVNPLELAELTHQMINIVEFLAEYY